MKWWRKLWCRMLGHNWKYVPPLHPTPESIRWHCKRCGETSA